MVAEVVYRQAGMADIPLLAAHHRMMFEEMRSSGDDNGVKDSCCSPAERLSPFPTAAARPAASALNFDLLEAAQKHKLTEQLADKSCIAWIGDCDGNPVASGGVSVIKTVPLPEDPTLEIGFLHSVYTLPSMRGRGIASAILDRLIAYCRDRGLTRVQLNASEQGRGVYRNKGFQPLDRVMLLWL
jgi:GNAT superfamily N-acetyltransferase